MNPNHYVSLPLAKRMKEAGFEQESEYYWATFRNESSPKESWPNVYSELLDEEEIESFQERSYLKDFDYCPTYGVTELGDILPPGTHVRRFKDRPDMWNCVSDEYKCGFAAETMPDAMALMALNLKEKGII